MTKSKPQNSKKNGNKKNDAAQSPPLNGFLPCFSKHVDDKFELQTFYGNQVFVGKVQEFVRAILVSPNLQVLAEAIHAKGGIQIIDPVGNRDDRKLCQGLSWQTSKVYRVDYGNNPYRLLFGFDNENRRCHILALDTTHKTRPVKGR